MAEDQSRARGREAKRANPAPRSSHRHLAPTLRPRWVTLGVPRFARQHAGLDPHLTQGALIFSVGFLVEEELGICVAMQPTVGVDFLLKLAGAPSRIAKRQNRALRSIT